MSYTTFCQRINAAGWTCEQLRCDVQPSEELLEFMDEVGLLRYERYVRRYIGY